MPVTFWGWLYAGTIILCWGAFLIVWSVGAIYNAFKAPTKQKQSGGWLFSWGIGVILVLVLVYFVPHGFWRSLGFDIFWLRIVGLILLLASTAFTLWARYILGLMWTSAPIIKTEHVLHTDGPYRITRHPIYTGLLGMLVGSWLMDQSGEWVVALIAVVILLEIKIKLEEHLLLSTFGEQYVQFKKRVPQLIPFVRWGRS